MLMSFKSKGGPDAGDEGAEGLVVSRGSDGGDDGGEEVASDNPTMPARRLVRDSRGSVL